MLLEVDNMDIQKELDQLPISACLLSKNTWRLYFVKADQAPKTVALLQQLRAATFRVESAMVLPAYDAYDAYHHHLVLWDTAEQSLVGAYRVGFVQEIIVQHGMDKIYAAATFNLDTDFVKRYPGVIELSGAFVQPDYQKNYRALLTLWQGAVQMVQALPYEASFFGQIYFVPPNDKVVACFEHFFSEPGFQLSSVADSMAPDTHYSHHNKSLFLRLLKDLEAVGYDYRQESRLVMLKHYLSFPIKCLANSQSSFFGSAYNALMFSETMQSAIVERVNKSSE